MGNPQDIPTGLTDDEAMTMLRDYADSGHYPCEWALDEITRLRRLLAWVERNGDNDDTG